MAHWAAAATTGAGDDGSDSDVGSCSLYLLVIAPRAAMAFSIRYEAAVMITHKPRVINNNNAAVLVPFQMLLFCFL